MTLKASSIIYTKLVFVVILVVTFLHHDCLRGGGRLLGAAEEGQVVIRAAVSGAVNGREGAGEEGASAGRPMLRL